MERGKKEKESKLYVHIIKRSDQDFEVAGLSEDKELWFALPVEFQNLLIHEILLSKPTIQSAIHAIKPINGYRKVGVKIDIDLQKEYFDEDGNLSYKNLPLEEIADLSNISCFSKQSPEEFFLIKRIKELETKLNLKDELKLHEVERKFILDKFDKTQNPTEWLAQFESECIRHKIYSASNMIEVLRFFVTGSPRNWYDSNLKKMGLSNWPDWKSSFFNCFVEKGWGAVRKAFSFKHIGGSLIDYALAKEKLYLEVETNCTVETMINMIVVGLPLEIQDQLDREEITTLENYSHYCEN